MTDPAFEGMIDILEDLGLPEAEVEKFTGHTFNMVGFGVGLGLSTLVESFKVMGAPQQVQASLRRLAQTTEELVKSRLKETHEQTLGRIRAARAARRG